MIAKIQPRTLRPALLAALSGVLAFSGWSAAAAAAAAGDRGAGPGGAKACSTTSHAAQLACRAEALDDYWIAIGNCANLDEATEVRECRREARADWLEGRGECGEQFDARQEACDFLGQDPYVVDLEDIDFVNPGDIGGAVAPNPYLPLVPGTRFHYANEEAGELVEVSVTYDTLEIAGVECVVVRDVVTDADSGDLIEDTDDFFAQDTEGNVWYLGEIARNYEDGLLTDLEGSWRAGVDDAKAGIVMKRYPLVGAVYRQEFLLGDAEDVARVQSLSGSAEAGDYDCTGNCLVTEEFTPIEPGVVEFKYYLPGTGHVLTVDPDTGEREVLVGISSF